MRRKGTERLSEMGQQVDLALYFYPYSDLELSPYFKRESIPRLDKDVVRSELTSRPGARWLFYAAARQPGTLKPFSGKRAERTVDFDLLLGPAEFHLSGEPYGHSQPFY
jgi:hypothetical protein